jgi:integrase
VLIDDLAYLRDAIAVALGTGLRRGELLSLKIEQVNLSNEPSHTLVKVQTVEVLPGCLLVPAQSRSVDFYSDQK